MSDQDDEPIDHEVFDTSGVTVKYSRTKSAKRVVAVIEDAREISEMKLYLILDMECRKLEKRLGIMDGDEDLSH